MQGCGRFETVQATYYIQTMYRQAVQDDITTATSDVTPWKGRSLLSQFQLSTCFGTHQTACILQCSKMSPIFSWSKKEEICIEVQIWMYTWDTVCIHSLLSFKRRHSTGARLHTANESSWGMGQRRVEDTVQYREECFEEYGWRSGLVDAVHCLLLLRLDITVDRY